MIVINFKRLDQFLDELKFQKDKIADKIVRYESIRLSQNEDQTAFNCEVSLTAICKGGDEDYLLECLLAAGIDIDSASTGDAEKDAGSKAAHAMLEALQDCCESNGLHPRPGKIEVF